VSVNRKVVVAKSAGFCWGVRRAFDRVLDVAKKNCDHGPVCTYGPLIHNPQAVNMLNEKGIGVINKIPDNFDGTIVIRTHGIPPEDRRSLETSGAEICDATCPDVGLIQGMVRKHLRLGYDVIIIGHKEHPEVKALLGFAENKGICVNSQNEVEALPQNMEKVCVVSQSTQQHEKFEFLVELIKKKYPNSLIFDTICPSTAERQREAKELAANVDAMIVVGGRNSSNTSRLAEISMESCPCTFFIETDDELDKDKLKGAKIIGVTAGASTPSWIIDRVVARLRG